MLKIKQLLNLFVDDNIKYNIKYNKDDKINNNKEDNNKENNKINLSEIQTNYFTTTEISMEDIIKNNK